MEWGRKKGMPRLSLTLPTMLDLKPRLPRRYDNRLLPHKYIVSGTVNTSSQSLSHKPSLRIRAYNGCATHESHFLKTLDIIYLITFIYKPDLDIIILHPHDKHQLCKLIPWIFFVDTPQNTPIGPETINKLLQLCNMYLCLCNVWSAHVRHWDTHLRSSWSFLYKCVKCIFTLSKKKMCLKNTKYSMLGYKRPCAYAWGAHCAFKQDG